MRIIRGLYLTRVFFISGAVMAIFFAMSYVLPVLYGIMMLVLLVFVLMLFADIILVFTIKKPQVKRILADRWSNGDDNVVTIEVRNLDNRKLQLVILDEIPEIFEARDFKISLRIKPRAVKRFDYVLRPLSRGEYYFGDLNLFILSGFRMVERRLVFDLGKKVEVYPSFHGFDQGFLTVSPSVYYGSAPVRKLGHSMEFEQISDYVTGDDIRNINWKATARKGNLMVNNYTDEKSQQVYCLIDKGRLMKLPFEGLTLLDHSINTCLKLVQTCLRRSDKVGLITYNTSINTLIAADKRPVQRDKILKALYNEETSFRESDLEQLYLQVRKNVKGRSLLVLFMNIETLEGLSRHLSYLRSLSKFHLLLVVFFENTEVLEISSSVVRNVEDVYRKAVAGQYVHEKRLIAKELNRHGILTVLSTPHQLTMNVLNKYLELKARQAL